MNNFRKKLNRDQKWYHSKIIVSHFEVTYDDTVKPNFYDLFVNNKYSPHRY